MLKSFENLLMFWVGRLSARSTRYLCFTGSIGDLGEWPRLHSRSQHRSSTSAHELECLIGDAPLRDRVPMVSIRSVDPAPPSSAGCMLLTGCLRGFLWTSRKNTTSAIYSQRFCGTYWLSITGTRQPTRRLVRTLSIVEHLSSLWSLEYDR